MTPHELSLLERVKLDPGHYLGEPSLSRFVSFQIGYTRGLLELGPLQQFIANEDFHHWTTRRLFQIDYSWPYPVHSLAQLAERKGFSYRLNFQPVERLIAVAADNDREAFSLYCALANEWKQDCVLGTEAIVPDQHSPIILPARGLLEGLYLVQKQAHLLSCSIHNLRAYIDGYLLCYQDHNQQPKDAIDFETFGKWLQSTTYLPGKYRWEKLILFKAGCEDHAFHFFFELLQQFLRETSP